MTLLDHNSSDAFNEELLRIKNEADSVMEEAKSLLASFAPRSNNNTSTDTSQPTESRYYSAGEEMSVSVETPSTSNDDNNAQDDSEPPELEPENTDSDIEEIVQEIPVVDLLDSTMDVGAANNTHNTIPVLERHSADDDDVIFVEETVNANPVTIDLSNDTFVGIVSSTPQNRRRRLEISSSITIDFPFFGADDAAPTRSRRARQDSPQVVEIPPLSARPTSPPQLDDSMHSNSTTQHDTSTAAGSICAICLEPWYKKAPMSTYCGHIFCKACITQCIRMTSKCPMCKKKLSSKQIIRLYL